MQQSFLWHAMQLVLLEGRPLLTESEHYLDAVVEDVCETKQHVFHFAACTANQILAALTSSLPGADSSFPQAGKVQPG